MKKSISFWSFNGKTAAQAMQLAKDAGFDGIELTLDAAGDLTMDTTDEQVLALRQTAERIGIALPSVASSLYWAYSFTSDDAAEREMAVQVNGKLRSTIRISTDASEDEIIAAACADEKIQRQMEGKTLVKTIVVKGKIVNLILK